MSASESVLCCSVVQTSIGTVQYVPDKDAIVWSIKQLQGQKEYLMRAHFGLPSITGGMLSSPAVLALVSLPLVF